MEWQRQQAPLFFSENLGHGSCTIVRPAALVCYLIAPKQRLVVALRQRSEDPARPERIPYIPNGSLNAPFLIFRPDLTRTRREVIGSGQFQQPWVEMNLVAAAFQHHTAKIVIFLWRTALCGGSRPEA